MGTLVSDGYSFCLCEFFAILTATNRYLELTSIHAMIAMGVRALPLSLLNRRFFLALWDGDVLVLAERAFQKVGSSVYVCAIFSRITSCLLANASRHSASW